MTDSAQAATATQAAAKATVKRTKASKPLPTDRIKFEKQLDILRAYATASGVDGRPVTLAEVARVVEITESTVSLGNAFWADVRLLSKADGGYVPAPEVVNFARAADFGGDPAVASAKLAPLISQTWFMQRLRPRLGFRALTEEEAIADLAEEAAAKPHHRSQLRLLLDYAAAAGVIVRDGGVIKLARGDALPSHEPSAAQPEPRTARPAVTTVAAPAQSEGVIQFQISVRVSMNEIATWDPQRIAAFFAGIGQVMTAKGKMNEDEGE